MGAKAMSEHTAIPWSFTQNDRGRIMIVSGDTDIALMNCLPMPERKANAQIIIEAVDNYERLKAENARLSALVEQLDGWLAKTADQLNNTPFMEAMDLGNEITQWRLERQRAQHPSTEKTTEAKS
jgi:hypothetical protein